MRMKNLLKGFSVIDMYLDTDCILALGKDSDWLKDIVKKRIRSKRDLCTSVLTIIECRLVLLRESTKASALNIEEVCKDLKITLLGLDEEILAESNQLMRKYDFLGTFDALHVQYHLPHSSRVCTSIGAARESVVSMGHRLWKAVTSTFACASLGPRKVSVTENA